MRQTAVALMSEADYIQHELKAERRSEYINGQLFEMPGEKKINNRMAIAIAMLFTGMLEKRGYQVYINDVKVAIPGGLKYRYPDVCVTAEPETEADEYILRAPALLVEVVSKDSHKTDYIDKLIEYTKIPSLEYYLIVEPEQVKVTLCERERDDWVSHQYTDLADTIPLSKLDATLPMASLYKDIIR